MARNVTQKAAAQKKAGKKAAGKKASVQKAPVRKASVRKAANGGPKAAVKGPGRRVFTVSITNTGQSIDCASGETILHAAVSSGIDYPYACASGNCGTCISQLTSGKISLLPRSDASLSLAQEEAKQTLACRARPRSDVQIAWLGRGGR